MLRFYLSTIVVRVDDGVMWPAVAQVAANAGISLTWAADDGRADQTSTTGWMVVWADVSDAVHAVLAAGTGVTWIPFETAGGAPLGPSDLIGDVAAARRTQIRTALESRHVPIDDLTVADPIRRVIARIIRRIRLRRALNTADITESLDVTYSSLSASRRNAISSRLTTAGYVTAGLVGSDTLRVNIQRVAAQDVPCARNGWD